MANNDMRLQSDLENYREAVSCARSMVREGQYRCAANLIIDYCFSQSEYASTMNSEFLRKNNLKNIFLAGVSRSGKSLLAQRFQDIGYLVIKMDEFRSYYFTEKTGYDVAPDSNTCRAVFYDTIFERFKFGVCIEGSDIFWHIKAGGVLPSSHMVVGLGIREQDISRKAESIFIESQKGNCRKVRDIKNSEMIAKKYGKVET